MPLEAPAPPLFRRLMGAAFDGLPPQIRAVHEGQPNRSWSGRCRVTRGTGWLSRLCGALASLPSAAEAVPLRVSIVADARGETWKRDFGGKVMRSTMRERDGLLEERLGPTVFRFALLAEVQGIRWRLAGVRTLGIPLPVAWFGKVSAEESLDGSLYQFDVRAELPVAGLLVHYRGTLDVT